jgi:hypothetical protein
MDEFLRWFRFFLALTIISSAVWIILVTYWELNSIGENTQENLLPLPLEIRDAESSCSFYLKLQKQQTQPSETGEEEAASNPTYPDPMDPNKKSLAICPSFKGDKETTNVTQLNGRPLIVEITKEEQELTAFDFTGLRTAVGSLGARDRVEFAKACADITRAESATRQEVQFCKNALIGLLLAKINRCAIYDYNRRQRSGELNCEIESQGDNDSPNWHTTHWQENLKGGVAQTVLYVTLRERVTDLLVSAFWRGMSGLFLPVGLLLLSIIMLFAAPLPPPRR